MPTDLGARTKAIDIMERTFSEKYARLADARPSSW
jgi:hypothetical protein